MAPVPGSTSASAADRRARFEALFETTRREVLAYTLRRTREPADAEDAAAETFAIAWRRLHDVPGGITLPWLYGVARRILANQRRGTERRWHLLTRLFERASLSGESPDVEAGPAIAALADLRPEDRELLQLVAWEELDHAELAATLGISVNAVAIRLYRARKRFAEAYLRLQRSHPAGAKEIDDRRTSTPLKGGPGGRPGQERAK